MAESQQVDIIVQLKLGNREAYITIVNTYRKKALVWAQQVVRDTHLAEDVVQESFLK